MARKKKVQIVGLILQKTGNISAMGKYFKFQDITKSVDYTKKKGTPLKSKAIPTSESDGPIGLTSENINKLIKLCKELLKNDKKITISNSLRRKETDPILLLMITPAGYRLRIKRETKQFDYIYEFKKNILILNKQPASLLDANRFGQFFEFIVSRMVIEKFEIIRESEE